MLKIKQNYLKIIIKNVKLLKKKYVSIDLCFVCFVELDFRQKK